MVFHHKIRSLHLQGKTMLGIEIINICNYKCYFCNSQFTKNHKVLTNEQFFSILDDAKALGIKHLDLTPIDGELFIDKDFLTKLKRALIDFEVMFYTNFSLCTPSIQDELKSLNNLTIRISDYGDGDREYFKYQTQQNDKAWDKYREHLSYAAKIGLDITIEYRGENHTFVFDNTNKEISEKYKFRQLEFNTKRSGLCNLQFIPRISIEGNMTYCLCGEGELTSIEELTVGNIYSASLEELYYSAKRLKIFNDQSKGVYNESCKHCDLFDNTANTDIAVYKHYAKMKKKFQST